MEIKINDKITVEVKIIKTSDCPAGSAYYTIDYLIGGICIHSATTGAIYGNPNPIAMLDRYFTYNEYYYQDVNNPTPKPTDNDAVGRTIGSGTVGKRPAWWEEKSKTHRQAIIEAVNQIVKE